MDPSNQSDAELVTLALAGDREAFGSLYDRYARLARAVVLSVSNDWRGVDDMTQECFLRAYRNLPKLREPDRFREWIVGTARKVGNERRRTLKRDRHEFQDKGPWEMATTTDGAAAVIAERDQMALVMQSLVALPEQERLAIHTFFLEGRDARQGAEVCGLSRSGFYALVQRAVARLATRLKPCDADKERT
jgi:RNA polymerase sigma factor (sigma-70 family)